MKKFFMICMAILVMSVSSVNATFTTTNSMSNPMVVDFSTQATVSNVIGPIQIGQLVGEDITVTGLPNSGLYTNFNGWGLVDNGTWGPGMTYISADEARPGTLLFSFNDGPISTVCGFMNHAPDQGYDLIISTYDNSMNLLESHNITTLASIVTPDGMNAGAFRGIDRGVNDITYFEVFGYVPVLDDLTFTRVPEPGTVLLLSLGGLMLRRNHK